VDFLDEQKEWSPSYSVSYILLVLQVTFYYYFAWQYHFVDIILIFLMSTL